MPGQSRISNWQFAMVLAGFLIGSSTLVIPVGPAGRDSWLSLLMGGAAGTLGMLMLVKLGRTFPGKVPAEYFVEVVGRPIGTLLALLYGWFCLHLGALVIENFFESYYTTVFTKTPVELVIACMAFLSIIAVYLGIEPFARSCEIVVPALALGMIFIVALAFMTPKLAQFRNLQPFMETGPVPVLKSMWANYAFPFGEALVLLSVIPFAAGQRNLHKYALWTTVCATLLLALIQVRNIMVLGKSVTKAIFPSLVAAQMIDVGGFITRLDSILLFVWTFGTFLKITICLFAATINAKVLFGVKEVKILAFPIGALMAGLSRILGRNTVEMVDFAIYSWPPYSLPFEILIPLAILTIAILRKRKTR